MSKLVIILSSGTRDRTGTLFASTIVACRAREGRLSRSGECASIIALLFSCCLDCFVTVASGLEANGIRGMLLEELL